MDFFDKYQQSIADAEKQRAKMLEEANKDPSAFLKRIGFDTNNLNIEELQELIGGLSKETSKIEEMFQGKNYKNLSNYFSSIKDINNLSVLEKSKIKDLGTTAILKDLENKGKMCFINDKCNKIIEAHSIQKNGELSKIKGIVDGKQQVLQFVENQKTKSKELKTIEITKASTFTGFCHKHDQIFEPIDKNIFESNEQKLFLYSFRSFAYSYHNIKSYQDYNLNLIEGLSSVAPLIKSLKNLSLIEQNLKDELNKAELPSISQEEKEMLEIVRFEKYRRFLIEYEKSQIYTQLDYLTYEVNHLSPIACSSWMVMHIKCLDGYSVKPNDEIYYGYPIMISVLPTENNKTKIILARFKFDSESSIIFNELISLKDNTHKFEEAISKLIIEKVENVFFQPDFWNYLDSEIKQLIIKGKNLGKSVFPEKSTEFEMINFFDEKYKLQ